MTPTSPLFKEYTQFLLRWEGGKSSNRRDTAASCAPTAGGVHTNKGVTYCTFRDLAGSLGISPVTYERFLALTDADVSKFLYKYYQAVRGADLPDKLAISMTEVAWGSGAGQAIKTLQRALNSLGNNLAIDGGFGDLTLKAVKRADPAKLYKAFWEERERWIRNLAADPAYSSFGEGWLARIGDFLKRFPPAGGAAVLVLTLAALGLWISNR